jgi:hypothetical protein
MFAFLSYFLLLVQFAVKTGDNSCTCSLWPQRQHERSLIIGYKFIHISAIHVTRFIRLCVYYGIQKIIRSYEKQCTQQSAMSCIRNIKIELSIHEVGYKIFYYINLSNMLNIWKWVKLEFRNYKLIYY